MTEVYTRVRSGSGPADSLVHLCRRTIRALPLPVPVSAGFARYVLDTVVAGIQKVERAANRKVGCLDSAGAPVFEHSHVSDTWLNDVAAAVPSGQP